MEVTFQQLQSLMGTQPFIISLIGVLAGISLLLSKLLHTFSAGMDFHDKNFVEKRLKRLQELRPSISADSPLARYLDDAVQIEAFRVASGISTSSLKMAYLLKLAETGRWDRFQLQALSRFMAIEPTSAEPRIIIYTVDKAAAWIGAASAVFFLILGIWVMLAITLAVPVVGLIPGALTFGVFLFAAWFVGGDFIRYLVTRRALIYLSLADSNLPDPSNSAPSEST